MLHPLLVYFADLDITHSLIQFRADTQEQYKILRLDFQLLAAIAVVRWQAELGQEKRRFTHSLACPG
jgi:hypothetical protein